jgi:hypothetical protein
MDTYYFNVIDGLKLFDPHGLELPDKQAAMRHGEELANVFESAVEVTDTKGQVLARCSPKR